MYIGADAGAYFTEPSFAFVPNIQVSLLSQGKVKPDPNWIFLGLGIGYEAVQDKFVFISNPVSYNIGHHLPLVNNVFIGPSILTSLNGDIAILAGIRAGLWKLGKLKEIKLSPTKYVYMKNLPRININ